AYPRPSFVGVCTTITGGASASSGLLELAPSALRAVERQLRRLVVREVRLPVLGVERPPTATARRAVRNESYEPICGHECSRSLCPLVRPPNTARGPRSRVGSFTQLVGRGTEVETPVRPGPT